MRLLPTWLMVTPILAGRLDLAHVGKYVYGSQDYHITYKVDNDFRVAITFTVPGKPAYRTLPLPLVGDLFHAIFGLQPRIKVVTAGELVSLSFPDINYAEAHFQGQYIRFTRELLPLLRGGFFKYREVTAPFLEALVQFRPNGTVTAPNGAAFSLGRMRIRASCGGRRHAIAVLLIFAVADPSDPSVNIYRIRDSDFKARRVFLDELQRVCPGLSGDGLGDLTHMVFPYNRVMATYIREHRAFERF
ncbi:hypothetical protein FOZ62_004704 [Perkinsus olseni]|uniref:Uncharacterized protein n=1 Tax=Perkinsus olseni TaxID=32597 RepID=A0A7J6SV59_PEROL|nr:hypothetical protein FOZ62_004704 [Perkinsus olseni]